MPGTYTVRLMAGSVTLSQPLVVRMDPRVKTSVADLQAQFDAAKSMYDDMLKATAVLHEGTVLRGQLKARSSQQPVQNADAELQSKLDRVLGAETPGRGGGRGGAGWSGYPVFAASDTLPAESTRSRTPMPHQPPHSLTRLRRPLPPCPR